MLSGLVMRRWVISVVTWPMFCVLMCSWLLIMFWRVAWSCSRTLFRVCFWVSTPVVVDWFWLSRRRVKLMTMTPRSSKVKEKAVRVEMFPRVHLRKLMCFPTR